MSASPAASRYAQALMDLGAERKNHDALAREIGRFSAAYSASDELSDTLASPLVGHEVKTRILDAIATKLSLSPPVRNFLRVLNDNDRLGEVSSISGEFERRVDALANRVRATVTSAVHRMAPALLVFHRGAVRLG